MDSVGLGQSFKERKIECENCEKLEAQIEVLKKKLFSLSSLNVKYPAEIDALERRVDELEDEKQAIIDDPEPPYNWRDDVD